MSSRVILLVVLVGLAFGYRGYGRFISRLVGIDPRRATPAHTRRDGVDYVPARHWLVLFGHHFSSICAAGPIVGPALAVAYWGWAPSLLWILLGGVLMGAVADFTSLMVAVRHGGVSISEVTGRVITPRARLLFSLFILITLVLVLAVFAVLTAGTFTQAPQIVVPSWGVLPVAALAGLVLYRGGTGRGRLAAVTLVGLLLIAALLVLGVRLPVALPDLGPLTAQTSWVVLLMAYSFIASVLPVQYLLQPRDYLSSYVLFTTIGLGVAGVLVSGPSMQAAVFNGFEPSEWPAAGPLWPLMFVTIACGAISGFHSVVSSGTTCKQLDTETHACRIGYGAMLTESLVATMVVIAVGAGLSVSQHGALLRQPGGAITAFGEGYGALTGWLLGPYAPVFAVMALNFFMLTTLDTATRLARYVLQEITGWRNRYLPTAAVVVAALALALSGHWRALWPAFGASNQLVGALALLVTSCWLLQRGRPVLPVLIPSLLLLVTTLGALVWQIFGALQATNPETGAVEPRFFMVGICGVLIFLALAVLAEAATALRARSGSQPAAAEPR
jgi:carbon starvation protein